MISPLLAAPASAAPYFYDARITNRIDQDGDGYARQFTLEFDVDSNVAANYAVQVFEDDGGIGDDYLVESATFAVSGTTADYHGVTILCSNYGSELTHGIAQFRIDLYSNGNLLQTWRPANDADLGGVSVELTSQDAVTFAPYFYDARITNRVDQDGDGYARQFTVEFDVDSNIAGNYAVQVFEDDGGIGDDYLVESATFAVNGTTADYHGVTITSSNHGSELSHGTVQFRIDLYASGTLIQTWRPANDPDLGSVAVELSSEDTVTFTPYFSDARITNRVDQDGDGYARQLTVEFDVDSNIAGNYAVQVFEDDGGIGDDYLVESQTFAVNGTATDYHGVTITSSNHGSELSHGTVQFRIDLYAAGTLIQTWRPSNDSDLGQVAVELGSEDTVVFAPYFSSARITNRVDQDGDGFARQLDLEFDVDSNIAGNYAVQVFEDDGGIGDDYLVESQTFSVDGTALDYRSVTIVASNYGSTLAHGIVEFRIDLYAGGNLIQTWRTSNDSDLGQVAVELSSEDTIAFTPYFAGARITNRVDQDGDGYARQFDLEFDVDSNIAGNYAVQVFEDDGGIGDDFLVESQTFSVNGTALDYRAVTIVASNYGSNLTHGTVEFRIDLYAGGNLIQTWRASNDPDLGQVAVELSSEDTTEPTTTYLTAEEAEGVAGEAVLLTATIEYTNVLGFRDSVGGLPVEIWVEGSKVGTTTSTSFGVNVTFLYTIPLNAAKTPFTWYAKFIGGSGYAPSQSASESIAIMLADPYGVGALEPGGALFSSIPIAHRNNLVDLAALKNSGLYYGDRLVNSTDRKIVIAIHGWNGTPLSEITTPVDTAKSEGRITDEWRSIAYDWGTDASTGGCYNSWCLPSAMLQAVMVSLSPDRQPRVVIEGGATRAAEHAYQHGLLIGAKLLQQVGVGNLRRVHLIGHSAGSWAVYGALRYLNAHADPTTSIQVTYLDPYIPADAGNNNESFQRSVQEASAVYARVTGQFTSRAEQYWSDDSVIYGTDIPFVFTASPNVVFQTNSSTYGAEHWSGHAGPTAFYHDTIGSPLLSEAEGHGWRHSLAYNEPFAVVVNQAAGQADPTSSSPIHFTVEFSKPTTTFTAGDVALGGSAGATSAVVTGGGKSYNVAVSGMTQGGSVVASVPANLVQDVSGNGNTSSTSTDNSVLYSPPTACTGTSICRTSSGVCDVPEYCESGSCPADTKRPNGYACTTDNTPCTIDQCDGLGNCEHLDDGCGSVCTSFSISPPSVTPDSSAGSQAVSITGSPSGCAGGSWTSAGNGSWLTVSPSIGSGPGSVTVSWTENATTSARSSSAVIAGNVFPVTQDASVPTACEETETVIQPGPEGQDTYWGTKFALGGSPNSEALSLGGWDDFYYDYIKFPLDSGPPSDQVTKAEIWIYVLGTHNQPQLEVRRITENWTEAGVTSTNHPASTGYGAFGSLTMPGWNKVDVTNLYKGWKSATFANHGVKLTPGSIDATNNSFASSDHSDPVMRPKLVVQARSSDCDDHNPCTDDSCSAQTGCLHIANQAACDDGLYCTVGDACAAGTCSGAARNCDDSNVCTTDSCDEAADTCARLNNSTNCNDDIFCNGADTCSGGTCSAHVGSPCGAGACNEATNACGCADGAPCRVAAGVCDAAELCTAGACPVDSFEPSSTVCRGIVAGCDMAEHCTGSTPACPQDAFVSSSVVCRSAIGICDAAEHCTGAGATCPANLFASSATMCRVAGGACDASENCTGSSASCPADILSPSTTICRTAAGPCDVPERCPGNQATCPSNSLASTSTLCRASVGVCDLADYCTGGSSSCPIDAVLPLSTLCRASAGICDSPESCTGTTAACPANMFVASSVSCRSAAGACDLAESCTGSTADCPSNTFQSSSAICRSAGGACDAAERCTGSSTSCPADVLSPSTAVCRAAAGTCDASERCSGTQASCPPDSLASSLTVCRPSIGFCDIAENCTGASAGCPGDLPRANGEFCDDQNQCTVGDVCSNGACSGTSTSCNDANPCTADSCSAGGGCVNSPISGACDDNDPCTSREQCENGACMPRDTRSCDDGDPCTDDVCVGNNKCSNPFNLAPCDDGAICTAGDSCSAGTCLSGTIDGCGCGDENHDGRVLASDALGVLRAAVAAGECPHWSCDFNGDGRITASDALGVLRYAVGGSVEKECPAAPGELWLMAVTTTMSGSITSTTEEGVRGPR